MKYVQLNIQPKEMSYDIISFVDIDTVPSNVQEMKNIDTSDTFVLAVLNCITDDIENVDITQDKVDLLSFIGKNSQRVRNVIGSRDFKKVGFFYFIYPLMFDFVQSPNDIRELSRAQKIKVGNYNLGYHSNQLRLVLEDYNIDSFSSLNEHLSTLDDKDATLQCDTIFSCLLGVWLHDRSYIIEFVHNVPLQVNVDLSNPTIPLRLIIKVREEEEGISESTSRWINSNVSTLQGAAHGLVEDDGRTTSYTVSETENYRKRVHTSTLFLRTETGEVDEDKLTIYASLLLQVMLIGYYDSAEDSELVKLLAFTEDEKMERITNLLDRFGSYILTLSEAIRLLSHPIELYDNKEDEQIRAVKTLFSIRLRARYMSLYGEGSHELPKSYINTAITGTGKSVVVLFYAHVTMQKVVLIADDMIGLEWEMADKAFDTGVRFSRVGSSSSKMRLKDKETVEIPSITYEYLREDNNLLSIVKAKTGSRNRKSKYVAEPKKLLLDLIKDSTIFVFDEFHKAAGINLLGKGEGTQTYVSTKEISKCVCSSDSLSMVIGLTATPGEDIDMHMWKLVNILGFGPLNDPEIIEKTRSIIERLADLYYMTNLNTIDYPLSLEGDPEEMQLSDFQMSNSLDIYTEIILPYNASTIPGSRPKARRIVIEPTPEYSKKIAIEREQFDMRESDDYNVLMQLTESAKADVVTKYLVNELRSTANRKFVIFVNYHNTFNVILDRIIYELGEEFVHFDMDRSSRSGTPTPGEITIDIDGFKTNIVCINGNAPPKKRTERVSRFQSHSLDTRVLVCSGNCGALGVNYGDEFGDTPRTVIIHPKYSYKRCAQELGRSARKSSKSEPDNYMVFTKEDISEYVMHDRLMLKGEVSKLFLKQYDDMEEDSEIIEDTGKEFLMSWQDGKMKVIDDGTF